MTLEDMMLGNLPENMTPEQKSDLQAWYDFHEGVMQQSLRATAIKFGVDPDVAVGMWRAEREKIDARHIPRG